MKNIYIYVCLLSCQHCLRMRKSHQVNFAIKPQMFQIKKLH